jgi:PadR family transcriptional regulator, regulatory protein PadR
MMTQPTSGQLDLLLLALLQRGPAHGYALVEQLRARTDGVLDAPEGSVYPALYRLERAGRLASREIIVGGRGRRVYQLTGEGERELAVRALAWHRLVTAVGKVVSLGTAVNGGSPYGST